jgi:hypothetical protein
LHFQTLCVGATCAFQCELAWRPTPQDVILALYLGDHYRPGSGDEFMHEPSEVNVDCDTKPISRSGYPIDRDSTNSVETMKGLQDRKRDASILI